MQISKSELNTSFSKIIKDKKANEIYSKDEDAWRQFLLDHREIIRKNSTFYKLKEEEMLRYRFRIRDFLAARSYKPGYDQVFRIINRIHNDLEFDVGRYGVWLPDINQMFDLRQTFNTENTLRKSLDTNALLQQKKFLN